MKRIAGLIFALVLTTLVGCGQESASAVSAVTETATVAPEPTAAPTPEAVEPEPAPAQESIEEEDSVYLEVNGQRFSFTLVNSGTAAAFAERLPAVWEMEELNGNEKFIYLDEALPSASEAVGQIETGDLMLYGDSCVVLFYKSFSTPYSYTRIGRLDDPSGLADAVGAGNVTASFHRGA